MTDRLTLRARQLLEDPELSQNQRVPNGNAMLRQLAQTLAGDPERRASMLEEITDLTVRAQMDAALKALGA